METATEFSSLGIRREEKIMIQHEKLQRIPSHPAHQQMQEATKNRLKRKSFLDLQKSFNLKKAQPKRDRARNPDQFGYRRMGYKIPRK